MTDSAVELIELLSDGNYHSGEAIGDRLGVSRAAVWKRVQQLDAVGLSVESVRGLGYRLPKALDLLDESYLRQQISPLVNCVHFLPVVDSTSTFLLSQSAPTSSVCIAEYQSAGRGRRGRQWVSPYGSNLYFSVSAVVDQGVAALEGLSLAIGLVIARTLDACGVEGVSLKWPNDILLGGKKLGGVLVEVGGDLSGPCTVVVGVGLNVVMPRPATEAIDQPWVDLSSFPPEVINRTMLISAMIQAIVELLDVYPTKSFSSYRLKWESRAAYLNQAVCIKSGSNVVEGEFCGVSDTGALKLKDAQGRVSEYVGGEVSLRAKQ